MIGLLRSSTCAPVFSRLKAFSPPAFISYSSPPHSVFLPHPTESREGTKASPTPPQAIAFRHHYLAEAQTTAGLPSSPQVG